MYRLIWTLYNIKRLLIHILQSGFSWKCMATIWWLMYNRFLRFFLTFGRYTGFCVTRLCDNGELRNFYLDQGRSFIFLHIGWYNNNYDPYHHRENHPVVFQNIENELEWEERKSELD